MSDHFTSRLAAAGEVRRTAARQSVEVNVTLNEEADLKKILFADADVRITAAECIGDEISAEGTVRFRTVYADSSDVPCAVELTGSFSKRFAADGLTGRNLTVTAQASELLCRVSGTRELTASCTVDLIAQQRLVSQTEVVTAADPNMQTCCATAHICTETGSACTETVLRQSSILPGNVLTPSRVLFTRTFGRVTSCQAVQGKLLVEGELSVFCLFATADEFDPCVQYNQLLPFHAALNADGISEGDEAFARVLRADTAVRLDTDEMGALRVLDYETELLLEGRAVRCEDVSVLTDCYCPGRRTEISTVPLRYVTDEQCQTFTTNLTLTPAPDENDGEIGKLCACSIKPCLMECVREDGKLYLRGIAETDQTFITLGNGTLGAFSTEEGFELALDDVWEGADEVSAELFVSNISFKATSPSTASVNVTLGITVYSRYCSSINAVSAIKDCGEHIRRDDGALIRICMGHAGETPWQVAKRLDVPCSALSAFCPDLPDVFEKNTKIVIFN